MSIKTYETVENAFMNLVNAFTAPNRPPMSTGDREALGYACTIGALFLDALIRIADAQETIAAQAKGPDPLATGTGVTGSP